MSGRWRERLQEAGIWVVAVGVAVVIVGVVVWVSTSSEDDSSVEATAVPVEAIRAISGFDCPDGGFVLGLTRGASVVVTAAHASEDGWVSVQNPADPARPLWIEADGVEAVSPTDVEVPLVDCEGQAADGSATIVGADGSSEGTDDGQPDTPAGPDVAAPASTSTTSTTSVSSTTTTIRPATTAPPTTTTTTSSTSTTSTTASTSSTTTSSVPDTTGPTITGAASDRSEIWERDDNDGSGCAADSPTASRITATVTDDRALASPSGVVLRWRVVDPIRGELYTASSAMIHLGAGIYESSVGPVGNIVTAADDADVLAVIEATDAAGNVTVSDPVVVALRDCTALPGG